MKGVWMKVTCSDCGKEVMQFKAPIQGATGLIEAVDLHAKVAHR